MKNKDIIRKIIAEKMGLIPSHNGISEIELDVYKKQIRLIL